MSIAHTAAALQVARLEPSSKLLLLVMALGADRQGRGEASPEDLHAMTGLSVRAIRTHQRKLFDKGLIVRERYSPAYTVSLAAALIQ